MTKLHLRYSWGVMWGRSKWNHQSLALLQTLRRSHLFLRATETCHGTVPACQLVGIKEETQRPGESIGQGNVFSLLPLSSMNVSHVPLVESVWINNSNTKCGGRNKNSTHIHNPGNHWSSSNSCHENLVFPTLHFSHFHASYSCFGCYVAQQ